MNIPEKLIRPRSKVIETFCGITGTIYQILIHSDFAISYIIKPNGLSPEDGSPLDGIVSTLPRLKYSDKDYIDFAEFNIPIEAMGEEVEDIASGFKGRIVGFVLHPNGCLHADVQPKGTHKKTGEVLRAYNFDLRMLKGKYLKELSDKQIRESEKKVPSPSNCKAMCR